MTMPRELRIRGLADRTTTERLTTIFAQAGTVLSARVVMERRSGRSRGFGFVTMRSTADAQRAIRQLDDQELDGGVLSVEMARRPAPRLSSRWSNAIAVPAQSILNARPVVPGRAPAPCVVVSFLVGAQAFRFLVDRLESLRSSTATAVATAHGRGCVAGCYYFLDIPDDVVRDVRNCLRRTARGLGGRACILAASTIEERRRAAWYSSPCPRCGGRFRPRNWLMPGALTLVCRDCEALMPG